MKDGLFCLTGVLRRLDGKKKALLFTEISDLKQGRGK